MRPVVLDTDVVSFLFKSHSRAQAYLPHLRDRQWLISFMTEAELEQWALLSNWHAKRMGGSHGRSPESWATPGNCRCVDRIDGHCVTMLLSLRITRATTQAFPD
jgi:hypothetical protein